MLLELITLKPTEKLNVGLELTNENVMTDSKISTNTLSFTTTRDHIKDWIIKLLRRFFLKINHVRIVKLQVIATIRKKSDFKLCASTYFEITGVIDDKNIFISKDIQTQNNLYVFTFSF